MLLPLLSLVSTDAEREFVVRAYQMLNKRLLAYAYKLSGNAAWAQDAAQQVFLELVTNLHRYRAMGDEELARYCFTIVRNSFYRWSKRNGRLGDLELMDADAPSAGSQTEDAVFLRMQRQQVKAALRQLPEMQRLIVMQKFAMGRTHAQIARELGISESRSQNLLAQAMNRIRKILGEGR